ncbi:MAG: M20/M25/M40 family metallo-hydrolase [Deltaproteobacteria bacterium]|nr:M20/M25/M40 family metallo-hydrolase [Deltaproteobacteria bacterium]
MSFDWGEVRREAVQVLADLIRLDTQNPPGNEKAAADYLAAKLAAEGIEPRLFEAAPKRTNVVARLKGNGTAPPLLLSAHLDVSPPRAEAWTHPPFAATEADGYLWGAGATSMKYAAAQALAIMAVLKRTGVALKRDLIFAGVADKVQGGALGAGYLVDSHRDQIQAEFCLTERGGMVMPLLGQSLALVGTATKGFEWLRVRVRGKPGFGREPNPESAFARLVHGLHRFANGRMGFELCGATNACLGEVGAGAGGWGGLVVSLLRSPITAPLALRMMNGEKRRWLEAALYHTAVVTGLSGGDTRLASVVADEAGAVIDGRYLPTLGRERFVSRLEATLGHEAELLSLCGLPPTDFPRRSELMTAIIRGVRGHEPNARVVPFLVPDFTDAAHYVRAGVISYGFFPVRLQEDEAFLSMADAPDERLSVQGFGDGLEILYDVVLEMCGLEPHKSGPVARPAIPAPT